jgi:hypothetical protein
MDIREEGFGRTLEESAMFSANASSYLASSAYAHGWLRRALAAWPAWNEVMFPGLVSLALAAAGVLLAARRSRDAHDTRDKEIALLYGGFGVLAFWASFGPSAGLYRLLFDVPVFAFLRAPARLAIVVVLALAVLGSLATARLLAISGTRRLVVAVSLLALAVAEMATPMPWERAVRTPMPYASLAQMPRGAIAEFPFYTGRRHLHAQYMLYSTAHWMPLLNGYSDHSPPGFWDEAATLESFPSDSSLRVLRSRGVRYVGVHWDRYGRRADEIRARLQPYKRYLKPVALSGRTEIYQIIDVP